jgi:hypothetical protein
VSNELRTMRSADPRKASSVDAAIRSIPRSMGEPLRIPLPGTGARKYQAILPAESDAPAVVYRRLGPDEDVDGNWLVTALIDRNEYEEYRHAERRGIVDNPVVGKIAVTIAGTASSIVANAMPENTGRGSGTA